MERKKTISVLVENQPGVLARIAGLFSGRGFNIDSLAVGETEDPNTSRMTIVAKGDELVLEQIVKQLNKLIDVIKVNDMEGEKYIERELAFIRVGIKGKDVNKLMHTVNIFRAKVLDVTEDAYVIEVTGTDDKINSFVELMQEYGVLEMVKSGTIAMTRSKKQ